MRTDALPASDVLVLYHADCPDGFAAALAAWLRFGAAARYLPCDYGRPAPAVDGAHVYILDFSFDPQVLQTMARSAASITLLDHHASARSRLAGLTLACPHCLHVDLSRSGAVLAWRHFHPERPLPRLYRMVQARDLWRWDEPQARDFLAWLDTLPWEFERWAQVLAWRPEQLEEAIAQGATMNVKFDALCQAIAREAVPVRLAGESGLMVSAPAAFASDVGHLLACRSGTFGLVWRTTREARVKCSLRSVAPYSVRALAEPLGGGGHDQAAAFQLPLEALDALVRGELAQIDNARASA
jgi:hypothetical protein